MLPINAIPAPIGAPIPLAAVPKPIASLNRPKPAV